jgi:prolyl oligopeptidase
MELYEDDYSRFGRLDNEIWRACRLVVDTGIHHFGWSRQKAIDYMLENTSLIKEDVVVEVDRYIVWPGQALSYKIGEMKIMELRQLAGKKLGRNFDIRQFHDVILSNGAVPLDILENNVHKWLK